MLTAVPLNAALCRLVRGYSVGANAATPDLWGFCGARQPAPRLTSHPACPGDGSKANPGHSAAMKGATQMVTSDRNSHPDPKPALEHADRMLRETGPVGSGAGAVAVPGVRSGSHFSPGFPCGPLHCGDHNQVAPFPAPAASNRACGSPAHGSPTSFTAGIRPCPPVPEGPGVDDDSRQGGQPELIRGLEGNHRPAELPGATVAL